MGTTICVKCLKRKATHHIGYVKKGKSWKLAGWCDMCKNDDGFKGQYLPEMK